ncbi:MAG: HD domain-containing protein [Anaerolineae bacterium]
MALTRLRQGILALVAWAREVDDAPARSLLSPSLLALFQRMSRREQQHALEVYNTLKRLGASNPALLTAGLLHDVGKMRAPLYLWDRVLIVLVEAAMPATAKKIGEGDVRSWRRPFVIRKQHAQWSAEMVAAAGADPLTVELIRRHQDKVAQPISDADRLLLTLQHADDAN